MPDYSVAPALGPRRIQTVLRNGCLSIMLMSVGLQADPTVTDCSGCWTAERDLIIARQG